MQEQCLLFCIDFFLLLIPIIDSAYLVTCSQGSLQCQYESVFLYLFFFKKANILAK